jgi:hypothetical protein
MSWLRSYRARIPRARELVAAAGFVVLLLLSELYYLGVGQSTFAPTLGWSVVTLALVYLGVGAVAIALAVPFLDKSLAASLPVAATFYGLVSVKVLTIDADFLGTSAHRVTFGSFTVAFFVAAWALYRRLRTELAFFVLVLGYLGTLKWLQRDWVKRGGSLSAFLESSDSLRVLGIAALICGLALACVFAVRRGCWLASVAGALFVLLVASIVRDGEARRMTLGNEPRPSATQPDIYVLSFDALRKDAFDERCKAPRSDGWRQLCERSVRFENVLSSGLQTVPILERNIGFDGRCEGSLPSRLERRGYGTTMFFGSRQRTIPGWKCFDHFYSGDGAELFGHFALPSVLRLFGPEASRLRFKFLETRSVIEALGRAQRLTQGAFFAYLHVLDLHAPYVSRARWTDDRYLRSVVPEFMSRCYLGHCDAESAHDRVLIGQSRASYRETIDDIEHHAGEVMRLASRRGRAFRLVVTADHGELFGEHGAFAHGGGFVPELLSVPFVVYDSTARHGLRDCRLLTSAEAVALAVDPSAHTATRGVLSERIEIDGRPLGKAIADRASRTISHTIADDYISHRGTWRNLHDARSGTVPWVPARCDENERR